MPVEFTHHEQEKYVEVRLTGKLDKDDYERFGPIFNGLVAQHGKLRMLMILEDFHGWTFRGLWEDIKFDVRHFSDLERLAIVGEKKWQSGMATFCKPFTSAAVKYFEKFEIDDAREWLMKEPKPQETTDPELAGARAFWTR